MKLAIVVGHNASKQGAVRKDTGETEFSWNGRLAQHIADMATQYGIEVATFRRVVGGGLKAELARVYRMTDDWGAEAVIELHFNGAESDEATGSEILSSGTTLSLRLAGAIQREFVNLLGLRDRGVKTVRGKDRGSASLISGKAPAVLGEPFFGSSPIGQAATDTEEEMIVLAHAYLLGATAYFETLPRKDLAQSRTMSAVSRQRGGQVTAASSLVGAVVLEAVNEAQGALEVVPMMGPFADALPYISAGLSVVALAATFYIAMQSAVIKAARMDDHTRGLR